MTNGGLSGRRCGLADGDCVLAPVLSPQVINSGAKQLYMSAGGIAVPIVFR
jgi:hypothetical protein